jgi:DNA-binding XRE family transcriptional regulator
MANLNSVLNDRIARVARKQLKGETGRLRKLARQYRSDIAGLKRQIASLTKALRKLQRLEQRRATEGAASNGAPTTTEGDGLRFRADGLRSLRKRLGLSAADFGKLIGASGLSIYMWESGKTKPRRKYVAKLAEIRGIGKREALKRLEQVE